MHDGWNRRAAMLDDTSESSISDGDLADTSITSSDGDESEETHDENDADLDIADNDLFLDLNESLRTLAETWGSEEDESASSDLSSDTEDDSDTSSTTDDEPLDTIDFHAEAERAFRAREEDEDDSCWYDEESSAMDDQQVDWWHSGTNYEKDWEWLEGYEPSNEVGSSSERPYDPYANFYGSDWDEGRLQYVVEQSRGAKSGREEGWYEVEEEQGVFWW